VHDNQGLYERESHAQAALRLGQRLIRLSEQVEDARQDFRFDSPAVITNAQHCLVTFSSQLDR
jgi:hypothetical protein